MTMAADLLANAQQEINAKTDSAHFVYYKRIANVPSLA
jgi:hypothetical protein